MNGKYPAGFQNLSGLHNKERKERVVSETVSLFLHFIIKREFRWKVAV